MSLRKSIANWIYQHLEPHEEAVRRIESLLTWQSPIWTSIAIVVIEIIFALIYFLPFSWGCNTSIVVGIIVVCYCAYNAFTPIFNSLSSKIPLKNEQSLHTTHELAAFITTAMLLWINLYEIAFKSIHDASIINLVITFVGFLVMFFVSFFFGFIILRPYARIKDIS